MKQAKGFTLIELMIVIAIVSILATIAMGFYGDSVISANRTEARSELIDTAGSLEKCKSLYGVYNSANCNVAFPITTDTSYYSITAALAGSTFALTATPIAGSPQASDADCTTLTLSNTGIKGATGANTGSCW